MTPALTYKAGGNYPEWRESIRAKLRELAGLDKIEANKAPLSLEIESEVMKDGYKQIRFTFESERGAIVPCYLLIPDTGKEKYPVAITLQGHSSGFHNSIAEPKSEEDPAYALGRGCFAVQAAKAGFIALAIEQRGMGERRPNERHQKSANMCEYTAHFALMLGRTILGERMFDVSCAIDALESFPQCDLDKILITGNSGGGTMSFYAATYDERIKLSVPSCAFCTYENSIMNWYHCSCNFIPHAYEWFEMQDLSALIAPRRLAVISGVEDHIFPIEGVERGFETVKSIYADAGVPDACRLVKTPKGHWWCEDIVWPTVEEECKKLGWI
jgi:hypothetical protein